MFLYFTILLAFIGLVYSDDEFLPNGLPDHPGMRAGYITNYTKIETPVSFTNSSNTLGSCSYTDTCSVSGYTGSCVSISSSCCSTGTVTSGLCAGSSDIKCCTQSTCTTSSASGTCMQTSLCSSKGGTSVSGYCVGPSDLQCCITGTVTGSYGVDVSTSISSSTASCLVSSGMSYIIPRGYKSTGSVDSNVCTSLKNAYTAGISVRDVYMFPCPTCSASASSQMSQLVTYLKANCATQWSGRIWLDIEGSQYWIGSTTSNKAWYQNLVDSFYSSSSQWSSIFGSTSYSYGSSLSLWYAHYDSLAAFSDFSAFGGWTSPHAKQYIGDATLCSVGVDKNYAVSF
eukprot:gene17909-23529_t